jgi:hypothetical protein
MGAKISARRLPTDATPAPPSTLVIFGASGDLTKRLLMPTLYNLADERVLDPAFEVVSIDHAEHSEEGFRTYLTAAMHALIQKGDGEFEAKGRDPATWNWLADRLGYHGRFRGETYRRLGTRLMELQRGAWPVHRRQGVGSAPCIPTAGSQRSPATAAPKRTNDGSCTTSARMNRQWPREATLLLLHRRSRPRLSDRMSFLS